MPFGVAVVLVMMVLVFVSVKKKSEVKWMVTDLPDEPKAVWASSSERQFSGNSIAHVRHL
jgi:hypothetical protein